MKLCQSDPINYLGQLSPFILKKLKWVVLGLLNTICLLKQAMLAVSRHLFI
jgi:hypothetical protein